MSSRGALVPAKNLRSALGYFLAIRATIFTIFLIVAHFNHKSAWTILNRWDAQWYRRIAENGYGYVATTTDGRHLADYAFFPLFPLLERTIHAVTTLPYITAGLAISAIASVLAATGIYKAVALAQGEATAFVATLIWALLPISIVTNLAYSEALFTAFAAWAIYFSMKREWIFAGAVACLAGLTRPTGIAVILAVVISGLIEFKRGRSLKALAATLIAPLGLVGYLIYVGNKVGSLSGYFTVTKGWSNTLDGGLSFAKWIGHLFTQGSPIQAVLVIAAIALLIALVYLLVKDQAPLPLVIFTITLALLSLITSGYFGSKPRYLLPAFGLLLPIAARLMKKKAFTQYVALTGLLIISAAYGALWLTGSGPL